MAKHFEIRRNQKLKNEINNKNQYINQYINPSIHPSIFPENPNKAEIDVTSVNGKYTLSY